MRCPFHQRQEIDALDPRSSVDRRNEPVEDRAELGKLGRSHLTEIQKMPPGLDYDRSRTGLRQRRVLGQDDRWTASLQKRWALIPSIYCGRRPS
jgi:hypothetical protein